MDIAPAVVDVGESDQQQDRLSRPVARRIKSTDALSALSGASNHSTAAHDRRYIQPSYMRSSKEDVSSASDSDPDHDYQTDFTTPAHSETHNSCPVIEEMQPSEVEDFRDREYPQLKGKTYLDHGGTTLYAKSMIEDFAKDMTENLYGNPHSASTPSAIAGHRVDAVRERALRFFNADPDHFDLVFVANATAAIKMVIDCFKDHAAASNTPVWYGYHKDAHTSLVGIRESTKLHRCFTSDEEVDVWINSGGLGGPRARQLGLFAYPGQSNMTGRRLPLSWPGRIRKSFHKAATYTLLDAAALASTAPLDLSDPATAPDFVALSFYKIFGFPNIGALIVRKDSAPVLESRKYFGGGTVEMIISINDTWHAKKDTSIHDRLEDGTLPFHSIFALDHAITAHERLYGPNPMKFISQHTAQLGKILYDGLSNLRHANGSQAIRIYKDEHAVYGDPNLQGATVAFNVVKSDGSLVGFADVEEAADERNIYVRSGSLCNPGGVASYLGWSPAEMKAAYASGHRCSNPTQIMLGKPTGVVRVSLGAMNTSGDVQILLRFLDEVYVDDGSTGHSLLALPVLHPLDTDSRLARMQFPYSPLTPGSSMISPQQQSNSHPRLSSAGRERQPSMPPTPTSEHSGWSSHASPGKPENQEPLPSMSFFNSSEYSKVRKPWEEELRKQRVAAAAAAAADGDSHAHETEAASLVSSRDKAASIKTGKFGRKMASLLRTKSYAADLNTMGAPASPPPTSTIAPDLPQRPQRSKWGFDKHKSTTNIEAI